MGTLATTIVATRWCVKFCADHCWTVLLIEADSSCERSRSLLGWVTANCLDLSMGKEAMLDFKREYPALRIDVLLFVNKSVMELQDHSENCRLSVILLEFMNRSDEEDHLQWE